MADKRISQLVDRGTVANNDVVPIVVSGATTTNKATISSIQTFMQENLDVGVTSVGITLGSSGTDVSVTGSPITTSGNITINIPDASATARGLVTTGTQTFAGAKTFNSDIIVNGVNVGRGGTNVPSNTRVGNSALQDNTTGGNNTAVGFASLIFTTTGTSNTAIGHQVLSNANGSVNTAVGVSSLFNLSTGDNNLGLGNQAGNKTSGDANHTTSNNSIFIGSDTKPAANNQINQIVIGHQAVGQGSNTVTIGNSSITSNKLFGRVIHADAVNADESATLGQVNTSLGGYVTLGTAQTITGSKTFNSRIIGQGATLTGSGSAPTLDIFHTSGSGIALDISKAGNGEGLRVAKTSGSGNAVTITGGLLSAEAATLTGALNGTSASFTGGISTDQTDGGTILLKTAGSNVGLLTSTFQIIGSGSKVDLNAFVYGANDFGVWTNSTKRLTITSTGAATFSSTIRSNDTNGFAIGSIASYRRIQYVSGNTTFSLLNDSNALANLEAGAATFSSSVTANKLITASNVFSGTIDFGTGAFKGIMDYSAGSGLWSLNNQSGGSLPTLYYQFQADGSPIMSMLKNGNVGIGTASPATTVKLDVVGDIRTSTGILFGADTAAANALDDYEEGTFTPTIIGNITPGTATYNQQHGRYTKIGRLIQFEIFLVYSSGTGTGDLRISGLPFIIGGSSFPSFCIAAFDNIVLSDLNVPMAWGFCTTNIIVLQQKPVGTSAQSGVNYDDAGGIQISGTYSV